MEKEDNTYIDYFNESNLPLASRVAHAGIYVGIITMFSLSLISILSNRNHKDFTNSLENMASHISYEYSTRNQQDTGSLNPPKINYSKSINTKRNSN